MATTFASDDPNIPSEVDTGFDDPVRRVLLTLGQRDVDEIMALADRLYPSHANEPWTFEEAVLEVVNAISTGVLSQVRTLPI